MLIAMAGLPGAGKSALASALARALGATVLAVDTIEAATLRAGVGADQPTGLAAYVVAEDLAREQLRLGRTAIVDAVNDVEPARAQWRALAAEQQVPLAFVEVICSDEDEHRRRLESRRRDELAGFPEPTWESVQARRGGFDDWRQERIRVDSMRPTAEILPSVLDRLGRADGVSPAGRMEP